MQNEEGIKTVERFFEAIYGLKAGKTICGKQTFAQRDGIGPRSFRLPERNQSRVILQPARSAHPVTEDCGIPAGWLPTGKDEMYGSESKKEE